MLKLFRRIRASLLSEGDLRRYLLYAVGEILLVVIGILIALQINNWNESKKLRKDEIHILETIQSDLEANISLLEEDLNSYFGANSTIQSGEILLNHLENRLPYHDSLTFHFIITMDYNGESLISSGYETLKSTGVNVISNKNLQNKIAFYFNKDLSNHEFQFSVVRQEFYHYIADFAYTLFEITQYRYDSKEDHFAIPENYEELLNNREYVRKIRTYHDVYINYQQQLMRTLDRTKELNDMLTKELNDIKK